MTSERDVLTRQELADQLRDEWYPLERIVAERYAPPPERELMAGPAEIRRRRRILLGEETTP